MSREVLMLEGVSAAYGVVTAVHNVSLTVQAGECVGLLGPNGAGKTTTLRTMVNLHPRRSGKIAFCGDSISRLRPEQLARRGLVLVPEGHGVLTSLSVADNLLLVDRFVGKYRPGPSRVPRAYERVPELYDHRKRRAGELSGGQLQLLAMARAVVASPVALLVDEPSMGLAPSAIDRVATIIAELKRDGVAVLLVEQNVSVARRLADRVFVLDGGRTVWAGSAGEFQVSDAMRIYLGD
ncbi:MAG: ABC transporter ATP-binding protein [Candidatus Dormibacteria bacterium]